MITLLSLVVLFILARLRHWLYWGRGRWISCPPPRNVVYLDEYRRSKGL